MVKDKVRSNIKGSKRQRDDGGFESFTFSFFVNLFVEIGEKKTQANLLLL